MINLYGSGHRQETNLLDMGMKVVYALRLELYWIELNSIINLLELKCTIRRVVVILIRTMNQHQHHQRSSYSLQHLRMMTQMICYGLVLDSVSVHFYQYLLPYQNHHED